ncbi:MAG: alpha/beta hydrolase [Rikenellaceae bacterium]
MSRKIVVVLALITAAFTAQGADFDLVYKQTEQGDLRMSILTPEQSRAGRPLPAVVFFHGGSWSTGSRKAFERQARYLRDRGIVSACVEYRLIKRHNATPIEAMKDAKSAVRYLRANAEKYNIDPDKIVGAGGSAGGHLAATISMCPNVFDASDDRSISTELAALVLFNPVVCNGPEDSGPYQSRGYEHFGDSYLECSPIYNVRRGVAPTAILIGDNDKLIPTIVVEEYARLIREVGGRCDLNIYKGYGHSFFNITNRNAQGFYMTLCAMDNFLSSLGLLEGEQCVDAWIKRCYPGEFDYDSARLK